MYAIYGFTFPPGPYDPLAGGSWPVTYGSAAVPAECFFAVTGPISLLPQLVKGAIQPITCAMVGLMFDNTGTEGPIDSSPQLTRGKIDDLTTATRGLMCQ